MIAFVDDWGDPTPGTRGTEWFGFGMIMIPDDELPRLEAWFSNSCDALHRSNPGSIHIRSLKGDNKFYMTHSLAALEFRVSTIAVKTEKISSHNLQNRGWTYRYFGREMIRVATHYASVIGERASMIFESHGYLEGFEEYINVKLQHNHWYMDKRVENRINYDYSHQIEIKAKEEEPLLSSADCIAHATHLAFNGSREWGMKNPTYLNLLEPCLWEGIGPALPGRAHGAQLKPFDVGTAVVIEALPVAYRRFW